jgi:insertion element IS1 protein InsB
VEIFAYALFMGERFQATPGHLNVTSPTSPPVVILHRLEAKIDELWSFVGTKANRHWVWIAMDATIHQGIAFHGDNRSRQSAAGLWAKIPVVYQERATFYTDQYEVYKGVIPSAQHCAISKLARKTNHVERFNCTLRQRVSRLVRVTLSFSKSLANHIGAIKYFICDYNLTRCAALPG